MQQVTGMAGSPRCEPSLGRGRGRRFQRRLERRRRTPRQGGGMTRTVSIAPPILYVGTPVVLISTLHPDGKPNLAPKSRVFMLGDRLTLGVGTAWRPFEGEERERG